MRSELPEPTDAASPFRRGDAIDRFTVLETLGMGGMGVVVSAYDCTLDRKVAIKVLRPDRLSLAPEEGRARLLREAQAMARLSHENVITVYEVGTIDDQVFVAMELVDGETLAGWLAAGPRPWREVVERFLAAGRGLAAAHHAGLVHRDFKPDNVLVRNDGAVRVTDFGLAGVAVGSGPVQGSPALEAPLTVTGAILGTPAYMAPEQHRGEELDARADQFSFCVALHEALYGSRPFAGSTLAELLEAISERRLAPPRRDAPGWLRPLILRGLEARAEDRWPSMDALLAALGRDPSRARRRWFVAGGLAAVLTATGVLASRGPEPLCQGAATLAASVWDPATRERVRAAFLATGKPHATEVFARTEQALARRLDRWAAAHTDACQATHVRGDQSPALLDLRMACLERARRQIGSLTQVWERERVDLESATLAATNIGEVDGCADTEGLTGPLPLPRDPLARAEVERIRARFDLMAAYQAANQHRAGLALAREALMEAQRLGHTPVVAEAMFRNGQMECAAGKADLGIALYYAGAQKGAEAHDDVLVARVLRALLHCVAVKAKRRAEAATVWTFAEAAAERAGKRDDLVAELLTAQAAALNEVGRHEEALERQLRAVAIYEKLYGPDYADLGRLLHTAAGALWGIGRRDEALAMYRRSVAIHERSLGPDHLRVANGLNDIAILLQEKADYAEAGRAAERSLAIREKVMPPGHPSIALGLDTLAVVRDAQGRKEEARTLLERVEKMRVETLGPKHQMVAQTRNNLAELAIDRGDSATARRLMESVIPLKIGINGPDHASVAHAFTTLGEALVLDRDWPAAEAAFTRSIAIWRKQEGTWGDLDAALSGLGEVRRGQRRHDEAIALHREALQVHQQTLGERHPQRSLLLIALGDAYLDAGRPALAVDTLAQAVDIAEKGGVSESDLAIVRFHLARALWARGERAQGLALAQRSRGVLVDAGRPRHLGEVDGWLQGK